MTADDSTPPTGQDGTEPRNSLETFTADALATLTMMHRREAETVLREVEEDLQHGDRVSEETLSELRQAVEGLNYVTEEYLSEFTEECG